MLVFYPYRPCERYGPTNGIGATGGQRKTMIRVGFEPTSPSGLITGAPWTELQGQTGAGSGN